MISLDENCSISRLISFEINFNFSGFLKSARARKCSEQIHQYIKRGSGKENQMRRRGYSRAPVRIFSLRLSVTVATMLMVYSDLSSLLVDIAFVFLDPMIGSDPISPIPIQHTKRKNNGSIPHTGAQRHKDSNRIIVPTTVYSNYAVCVRLLNDCVSLIRNTSLAFPFWGIVTFCPVLISIT